LSLDSWFDASVLVESHHIEAHIPKLRGEGKEVKFLRCDNAGKNQELINLCARYGITIEFTAPHTPQQNGVVERMFVTC